MDPTQRFAELIAIRVSRQCCRIGLVLACLLAPAIALAQAAWTVTVTPTLNPLPIGFCAAVQLTIHDASMQTPRNPLGAQVTIADFDMSVAGASVVGQQIDRSHWQVCACQGGAPGTVATITASYPAQALATTSRVPGVALQGAATFALSAPRGAVNPPACLAAVRAAAVNSPTGLATTARQAPPQAASLPTPVPQASVPSAAAPVAPAATLASASPPVPVAQPVSPVLTTGPVATSASASRTITTITVPTFVTGVSPHTLFSSPRYGTLAAQCSQLQYAVIGTDGFEPTSSTGTGNASRNATFRFTNTTTDARLLVLTRAHDIVLPAQASAPLGVSPIYVGQPGSLYPVGGARFTVLRFPTAIDSAPTFSQQHVSVGVTLLPSGDCLMQLLITTEE